MGNGVTYRKPDSDHPIKLYGPMEAHPVLVNEVMRLMRRAGLVPEDWVADPRAPEPMYAGGWDDAEQRADAIVRQIRDPTRYFAMDRQLYQPVYIEVLCEAEGLMQRLHRVSRRYGVPVYSGAGFDGIKGKRAFAERAMARDVPTVVLNVGDRDDRGEDAYRAAAEDAIAWVEDDTDLRFERIALTTGQADGLGLLDADGKAEAEGVPVPVMDRWLREAIERLQDPSRREQLLAEEQVERERLPEAIREALEEVTS